MRKYWVIIKTTFQRALVFRFSIVSYRVGEILENLVLILMWTVIFGNQSIVQGFTLPEMITYVLVGNLVNVFVRNFLSDVVSADIKDGRLSIFLVRPMHYASYIMTRELGRVILPFIFSVLSQIIVILFFLDKFIINLDPAILVLILTMIILAFITEMLISFLIGLVAFWTLEVDGLFMTFYRVKRFFSGGYFPISILPAVFVKISYSLPFAYSFFVPTQLYLKKINIMTGIKGIFVQVVWIILLYFLVKLAWRRGLKKYEGVGI